MKGSSENSDVPRVELGLGLVPLINLRRIEIKAIKILAEVIPSLHTATLQM